MDKKLIIFILPIMITVTVLLLSINLTVSKGTIYGKVTPSESGIRVQVTHDNKFVAETTTDMSGNYLVSNLPPNTYGLLFIRGTDAFIYNDGHALYDPISIINVTDVIDLKSISIATFNIDLNTQLADFKSDMIHVSFKNNISEEKTSEIITSQNCQIKEKLTFSYFLIIQDNKTVMEMVKAFKQIPEVDYANSYNFVYGGGN